ncbi:MAG: glycosyltransferase [bacterium]
MKKVLIITRDFPPNLSKVGWMIRTAELANYLVKNGYQVDVLACERSKKWPGLINVDEKVNVHSIKGIGSYFDVPREDVGVLELWYKVLRKISYKFLKNHIVDFDQLDKNKYINEALKIIKKKNIKNVFVSAPPCSLHLVAEEIKNNLGNKINLIVDYRDAWTLRKSFIKGRNEKMLKKLKNLEQRTLSKHNHTIFVSSGMKKEYLKKFNINASISIVENGFINYKRITPDSNFIKKVNQIKQEGKIIIGYFGTGSANGNMPKKDFSVLLEILNKEENKDLASQICLVLQGHVPLPNYLPENLKVLTLPAVSNKKARANMREVDLCLFVYSEPFDASLVMGGKVYDYIASGNPIWLIIPNNSYSLLDFAKVTDKPFISDIFDVKSIENKLRFIIDLWKKNKLSKFGFTKEEAEPYCRDNQYDRILEILE